MSNTVGFQTNMVNSAGIVTNIQEWKLVPNGDKFKTGDKKEVTLIANELWCYKGGDYVSYKPQSTVTFDPKEAVTMSGPDADKKIKTTGDSSGKSVIWQA